MQKHSAHTASLNKITKACFSHLKEITYIASLINSKYKKEYIQFIQGVYKTQFSYICILGVDYKAAKAN